jgi:hypothetical protein
MVKKSSKFTRFNREKLLIKPLAERDNLLDLSIMANPELSVRIEDPRYRELAAALLSAQENGSTSMMLMGAHVIRAGMSPLIIRMMEEGLFTNIGFNGAGAIHDFEFSLIGETTESVPRYIQTGEFGLWKETGKLNEIVKAGTEEGLGFGESIGKYIVDNDLKHQEYSILAAGYRLGIPVTVHIGLGYDIIHEHPNCDGASLGKASMDDFLVLAERVSNLESGVFLNYGTAVMGPEVYLKALSMARNLALQEDRVIKHFTTAVFDLAELGDVSDTEPEKTEAKYYFRPLKTILIRTVNDGGRGYYFRGDHKQTFPQLFTACMERLRSGS